MPGEYHAAVRQWPTVRAVLVTLAIGVGLADGCPLPPVGQAHESVREPVRAVKTVRRVALTPFRPLGELLRLRQRWKLFPTARRDQVRMWIEARDRATQTWGLVYRPHDDEHDVMADRLEYRRLRAAWNPGSRGERNAYGPFVKWLAGELFERDAGIDRVRVQMEAIELRPAQGHFVGLGTFTGKRVEAWPEARSRPR